MDRCNQRDVRLALETDEAAIEYGRRGVNGRLKIHLEFHTILYEAYRYAHCVDHGPNCVSDVCFHCRDGYFCVINLIGTDIFKYVGDHHRQRDGVLAAEAAKIDDMIERIRRAAD